MENCKEMGLGSNPEGKGDYMLTDVAVDALHYLRKELCKMAH